MSTSEKDSGSLFAGIFSDLVDVVSQVVTPEKADASTGTPFGGALEYAYFCTCSYNWLLYVEPLPPTYAALLTYEPFSQAYMGYNIPYTEYLLGSYSTGGACAVYGPPYECYEIPTEGYVMPATGSSGF